MIGPRVLAALVTLALSLSPLAARADVAPPPVVMHIEGQSATLRSASPDRADFVLRNVSDAPIDAFLFRVVVIDGTMRVPLEITRVEIDGAQAARNVRVPAGARLRVTVHFAMPQAMQGRGAYSIELSLRQDGYGASESTPAQLTRAARGPAKWALSANKHRSLY